MTSKASGTRPPSRPKLPWKPPSRPRPSPNSRRLQVHPVQISQWKKQLLDGIESLFRDGRHRSRDESEAMQAELYAKIGRLDMEIELLKKTLPASVDLRRDLVDHNNSHLSICRQCELLGLNRSTYYLPPATVSEEDLRLMRLIDEQYLKTPFYGSRRMAAPWSGPGRRSTASESSGSWV